jgi:hypothetical protein
VKGLDRSRQQRWQLAGWDWWTAANAGLLLCWCAIAWILLPRFDEFFHHTYGSWFERTLSITTFGEPSVTFLHSAQNLSPTERLAYERFRWLTRERDYEVVRLQTPPFSQQVGRHSVLSRRCQIVHGEAGEIAPVSLTVLLVHPTEERPQYEVLTFVPAAEPAQPGTFSFDLPACKPDDYLVVLSCLMIQPGKPMGDPKRLIRLE